VRDIGGIRTTGGEGPRAVGARVHLEAAAVRRTPDGARRHASGTADPAPAPTARIRIAYCIDTMRIGGSELNALRTSERLDRSQFEISVVSLQPDGPLANRYAAAGIPVHGFPLTSLYAPGTVRQGWRLAQWLRRERIDILHCHDLYANLFGAPWGRIAGLRAVITSRRWIHPLRNRQLEIANRVAYRLGHWVLVNSPAVANAVMTIDGVSAARVLQVPNFVDAAAFTDLPERTKVQLRSELGIPADALVVGCIARLAEVKDHATLLRAMQLLAARSPDVHLVLVGDGELRVTLETLASDLGIRDRVHFAGARDNEPNLHHLFDISTLASVSEGFPNSLVEAMAAGRPVVATNVGGNADAVRPDTGVLVPVGNAAQLASALERLVVDQATRHRMGVAARAVARSEYYAGSVIPRLEQIYRRLAGRSA
jgi:glycosyltransferase involved in cell wall biosynthesis